MKCSKSRIEGQKLLYKERGIVHRHEPEGREVAALEIQRIWRGFRVRYKLRKLVEQVLKEIQSGETTPVFKRPASPKASSQPTSSPYTTCQESSHTFSSPPPSRKAFSQPTVAPTSSSHKVLFERTISPTTSSSKTLSQPTICPTTSSSKALPRGVSSRSSSRKASSQLTSSSTPSSHPDSSQRISSVDLTSPHPRTKGSHSCELRLHWQKKNRANHRDHSPLSECISHRPEKKVDFREPRLSKALHQLPFIWRSWTKAHRQKLAEERVSARHLCVGKRKRHGREGEGSWEFSSGSWEFFSGSWSHETLTKKPKKMTKKSAPRLALEASYDRYVQKALEMGETSTNIMPFMEYCAHRIQVWWLLKHRAFLRERFIQRLIEFQKKAAVDSASAMNAMTYGASFPGSKKRKRKGPMTQREAAISIQRAWRRHIDIQVYRYYRDLINFKSRGNPAVMLRCINPNEAKLLDPASGTSVRFRLAGERFPPNIYYKIFTHRPVQDMCANSPKDYTKAQAKQLNVRHRHNKVAAIPQQEDDKCGWYQRCENNGWRLVSDRLIQHYLNDPTTWESSRKTYQFNHSKLKRKQDVEKEKKSRKIEWMKKMYKQGMLRARSDDQETVQLIEGAAAGMMATVHSQGPDALEDWEVDELLDWTTSLNFEEYFSTWKDLATSAAADCHLEKSVSISTSKSDPYELTVSTAPSRFQSTRQSRHTTATLTSGSIHVKT
ncbi:hypothetical protein ACOMHN_008592 [Nucella lapillus]